MPGAPSPLPGLLPSPSRPLAGRVAQAEMRASNMGLILRRLHATGGRSRAQLAAETGLSKATTSSLVAELADRGLVREGALVRDGAVGRPGQVVSLDGSAVAGMGVEISVNYLTLTAVSLGGTVLRESVVPMDVPNLDPTSALDRIYARTRRMLDSLSKAGINVIGITFSPPGAIDYATGAVRFAPNLGWHGIPLVAELTKRTDRPLPPIMLENDAKLSALAEYEKYSHKGVRHLLTLTGQVGIGAGIVSEGRLVRGWQGFSGEVGHLPLDPDLTPCKCGRSGCWETIAGLNAFVTLATEADDPLRGPGQSIEDTLFTLRTRADVGNPAILTALETLTHRLERGLRILIDVLDPQVIVLGGYYAYFADFIVQPLQELLDARRMTEVGTQVAASRLGLLAAARGGALLALERILDDPTVVPAS